MAIAHVKDASSALTFSAATSASPAFASNVSVGNVVVLFIVTNSNTVTMNSVTGLGATWLWIGDWPNTNGTTAGRVMVWMATCATAGTTLTLSFSGSVTGAVSASEFSGCSAQMEAYDASQNTSRTGQFSPGISTRTNGALVMVGAGFLGSTSVTTPPGAPWTTIALAGGTATGCSTTWQIQSTSGALGGANWTLGTAREALYVCVAIQSTANLTPVYMRQARTVSNQASTGTSLTAATMTPLSGSILIGIGSLNSTSNNLQTFSDTVNTWSRGGSAANSGASQVEVWYALNVANSAVSIKSAWTTATFATIVVAEWVGLSAFDTAGTQNTGTSGTISASVTTLNANDMVMVAGNAFNAFDEGGTAGWGSQSSGCGTAGGGSGIATGTSVQTATGTYTDSIGISNSTTWAAIAVAFKLTVAISGFARPHRGRKQIVIINKTRKQPHFPQRTITPTMIALFLDRPVHEHLRRKPLQIVPLPRRKSRRVRALLAKSAHGKRVTKQFAVSVQRRVKRTRTRFAVLASSRAKRIVRRVTAYSITKKRSRHISGIIITAPVFASARRESLRRKLAVAALYPKTRKATHFFMFVATPIVAMARRATQRRKLSQVQSQTLIRRLRGGAPGLRSFMFASRRMSGMANRKAAARPVSRRKTLRATHAAWFVAPPITALRRRASVHRKLVTRAAARTIIKARHFVTQVAGAAIDAIVIWRNRGGY